MIELEKFYECAGRHLVDKEQDWAAFAEEFKHISGADFVLYRPSMHDGVLAWRAQSETIATSHPKHAREYVELRVFEKNAIPESSLSPFEPSKRSDLVSDEEFCRLEVAQEFFIPRGIFYLLGIQAKLSDDSLLMMVAWRDQKSGDFTSLEKQRMTLFMRYLSTLVQMVDQAPAAPPDRSLDVFGEKYSLTKTEVSVLSALLQGKSLKDIARESGRTYGTVRWHVQNILEKCHVKTQKNLLHEFYGLIKR